MLLTWCRSSIGKKALMAASGLALTAFVFVHLLGNLMIYLGPNALNAYARKLRELGPLLWLARGLLVGAALLHVWTSVSLARENRAARPVPYAVRRTRETTRAARTMMLSGVLALAYLVYHLLHFTFRVTHPSISHLRDSLGRHDVYAMVVLSFRQWPISLAYVLGVACLSLHLSHGMASAFQSLGFSDERTMPRLARAGRILALAMFIGYASIPVAVWLGLIRLPGRSG